MKNFELNRLWFRFVNRKDWKQTKRSILCERHFEEKYIARGEKPNLKRLMNPIPTKHSKELLKCHQRYYQPAQPARNIPRIFAVCSLSIAIFGTSREHLLNILKEKIFLKRLDRKIVFVLKVYDLIIKNVHLLANSSNHEVMFPEFSRNIPRMSVLKIFQGKL